MNPLHGDAAVLLRAGQRCGVLALELKRLQEALGGAADQGARAAVESFGALVSSVAYELADAHVHVRRSPEDASAERQAIDERITMLWRRFHRRSLEIESDMKQLLLRRRIDPSRWTGPVRPPVGWAQPPTSVRPLPPPVDQEPGAARLPWTPPWLNAAGDGPARTRVHPLGVDS